MSGWPSLATHRGFPCCVRFPCVHAAATTPVQRTGVLVAQNHPSVSAFPGPTAGSACTLSFSKLAQRSLTLRPTHSHGHLYATAIRRLQTLRHLHACSGCFRLERVPGGACTRWRSAAFSRRTWRAVIRRPQTGTRARLSAVISCCDPTAVPAGRMKSGDWKRTRHHAQGRKRWRMTRGSAAHDVFRRPNLTPPTFRLSL